MRKLLLETSSIIEFLRGKEEAVSFVEGEDCEFVSSFLCLSELFEGVFSSKNASLRKRSQEHILEFFDGLKEVYGLDRQIAKKFGEIRFKLRSEGKLIEDIDILLAATCLAKQVPIVTYNVKHFQSIDGLEVITP